MTWGGRLAGLFPTLYLVTVLSWIGLMLLRPAWWSLLVLLAIIYLVPVLIFRLHELFLPVREGSWDLSQRTYSPWWTAHMLQLPFIAVPWLEGALHLVPGLYSIWLRAWGASVGKNVYWTPRVEVLDRSLVEIGDGVVLGHLTAMSSHMVAEVEGRPRLILKKVVIGKGAFVGADTQLGPGARIEEGARVKPKTRLYWRGEWS